MSHAGTHTHTDLLKHILLNSICKLYGYCSTVWFICHWQQRGKFSPFSYICSHSRCTWSATDWFGQYTLLFWFSKFPLLGKVKRFTTLEFICYLERDRLDRLKQYLNVLTKIPTEYRQMFFLLHILVVEF